MSTTTITSIKSSYWGDVTAWDLGRAPADGDQVVIASGHKIQFGATMATGVAGITINGVLHFDNSRSLNALKVNGDIDGTGELWVCNLYNLGVDNPWFDYETVRGLMNQPSHPNLPYFVDTANPNVYMNPYSAGAFLKLLYNRSQEFTDISTVEGLSEGYINYLNTHPGTYYFDTSNNLIWVHLHDSGVPNTTNVDVLREINRPEAGNEYQCSILLNETGTITVPIIKVYGWHPEKEFTTLSQDAASGQNQVVLTEELDLQAGVMVGLGSGEVSGKLSEVGVYTVSTYDSMSKIVTFTGNLQTNRLAGDYINILSSPIRIERTENGQNKALIPGAVKINNVTLIGCTLNATLCEVGNPSALSDLSSGWEVRHTKIYDQAAVLVYGLIDSVITDCNAFGGGFIFNMLDSVYNSEVENCCAISTTISSRCNCEVLNSVEQNAPFIAECKLLSEFVSKNGYGPHWKTNIKNSYIEMEDDSSSIYDNSGRMTFIDTTLKFLSPTHPIPFKAFNCLIEGEFLIKSIGDDVFESFDHNQIKGNYKAWMSGGKIETALDGTTILPGRLILTCESADYPVFRDFPVLLPAYRTSTWQALTKKSFTGGSVKIELIDPANDPLIDPSAAPLATYSLPDTKDTNLPLKLGYKSEKAMQAIIRISAQKASGTVEIDTRLIENRVQHGQ